MQELAGLRLQGKSRTDKRRGTLQLTSVERNHRQ